MCDQDHFDDDLKDYVSRGAVTRRQFGAVTLGAGFAFVLPRAANAQAVKESDVKVTTPDGVADCYFVHPASGAHAGVIIWPDILGLRPAFRQMGKRLAESGYSCENRAPQSDSRGIQFCKDYSSVNRRPISALAFA